MKSNFTLCAFADEADTSLSGQIAALKENGIQYLEIRGVDGKNVSEITEEEAGEIKARLDDAGILVWSIGSPIGKIDINGDFEKHMSSFCHLLNIAKILGAKCFRLFSFYGTEEGTRYEDTVFEYLNRFVERAKGSGVLLCHENEKGIYGDIVERCLHIHKLLPDIKAVFDPANFIQCGVDVLAAWEKLAPYVEYIHIKDAKADGTIVTAGNGIGQIPKVLTGFGKGILTLEPHLHIFNGIKDMEEETKASIIGVDTYTDQRTAFDAAVTALRKIIVN